MDGLNHMQREDVESILESFCERMRKSITPEDTVHRMFGALTQSQDPEEEFCLMPLEKIDLREFTITDPEDAKSSPLPSTKYQLQSIIKRKLVDQKEWVSEVVLGPNLDSKDQSWTAIDQN